MRMSESDKAFTSLWEEALELRATAAQQKKSGSYVSARRSYASSGTVLIEAMKYVQGAKKAKIQKLVFEILEQAEALQHLEMDNA
mmetsp:Transcript_42002/g.108124  ORF Transcript_42002/g.108124 Transcript_42002/m.108124 type:complete len:85 (-) Transcript_42002:365-619(-)